MSYWQDRLVKRQDFLNKRTTKEIDKQLAKYYEQVMKKLIKEFEAVYDKLLTTKEEDLTPADLYKMDKYWQMQAQVREELEKLGYEEIALLSTQFENHWRTSYENTEKEMLAIFNSRVNKNNDLKELEWPPTASFSTISSTNVQQMVNEVWCADGKTWSDRVWDNIGNLTTMLNDELIHCVTTGKKTTELKKKLQDRFHVSYSMADRLVRTEVAHIQTQSAARRYKDAGLKKYEILGREEGSCKKNKNSKGIDCHEMHGKQFLYSEMKVGVNAPPFHPNCRCAITPVFDDDDELENEIMEDARVEMLKKVEEYYPNTLKNEQERRTEELRKQLQNIDNMLNAYKIPVNSEATEFVKRQIEKLTAKKLSLQEQIDLQMKQAEWIIYDYVFCMDCGKPMPINGKKTNAVKRCPECQAIHRKKQKAEYERARRRRKKIK